MNNLYFSRLLKQVALTALIIFIHLLTYSQPLYNRTYKEDRASMLFSSIIQSDTEYKIIGVVSDYNPQLWGYGPMMIGKVNDQGNITQYKAFYDGFRKEYGVFENCLIKTSDGRYAFTGYANDSLPRTTFSIFTPDLDTVQIYEYQTPLSFALKGERVLEYDTNIFFISGLRTDSNTLRSNVMLMKIDSAGNKLWEKYYGLNPVAEFTTSFIKLNNGNMMIGSYRRDFNLTRERSYTWLLEVDTGGTIVRQWLEPNDSTYGAYGLIQTMDGGFIYAAQRRYEQFFNSIYTTATIVKMDDSFNKQWTYRGGGYRFPQVFLI